jgi:glycyl-radical enzyme activating protein
MTISGNIVSIQRFCTHDGPGIRTVVFLKGCLLRCLWCQNPESFEPNPELLFNVSLCRFCGRCAEVCPNQAHAVSGSEHHLDREKCRRCFQCVPACPAGALERIGMTMTVEEIRRDVAQDRVFYETSGGGVTLSGGDPLAQMEFVVALLEALRADGIHVCVETSGFGRQEDLLRLARLTDLLLWDVKGTDEEEHLRHTGVPLQPILDNLRAVDATGAKTVLRCPLVANVNLTPQHLDGIAAIACSLRHCQGVQLLPYHSFGTVKATRIGKSQEVYTSPDSQTLANARKYIADQIAEQSPPCDVLKAAPEE